MRTFLRVSSALLCLVLVAGVTYGAQFVHRPPADEVQYVSTEITSPSVALMCPGPAQLADDDWERDAAYDPSPVGTKSAVAGVVLDPSRPGDEGLQDLSGAPANKLTSGLDAAVGVVNTTGPRALWAQPDSAGIVRAAAVGSSITTAGDLRSLGAMSCGPPEVEQWLVGGTTVRGASSRLVMQNPSQTSAAVQIEVWGPSGKLELTGPSSFSVPAGGQTATLLEGLAAEQRRLTVRVVSTGALVSSYVQVNELDGVRPLGMDFLAPSTAPARRQVINALTVQKSDIGDEAAASVRLLAPGAAATSVRLTILGENGRELLPGAETLTLAPGAVTDVSLAGLAAGTYSVVVESDEPIVTGGRFARKADIGAERGEAPVEFAFVGSRPLPSLGADAQLAAESPAGQRLAGPGSSGVLAVPRSGSTMLNLLVVPDQAGEVPFTSGGASPEESGAADTDSAAETADDDADTSDGEEGLPAVTVQVVLIDEAGHSIGTYPIELRPGVLQVVDPSKLNDSKQAAAVYVSASSETAAQLSWSAFTRVGAKEDELVSTLLPIPAVDTRSEVILRPGTATGLGTRGLLSQKPM